MIEDLTPAWQLFDDQVHAAKENCFTSLAALVDDIAEDLAGKRLHPLHTSFDSFGLTRSTAEEGVSVEPMAPFLSSLASKKILLRKCLDDFSAKVDSVSRYKTRPYSYAKPLMGRQESQIDDHNGR